MQDKIQITNEKCCTTDTQTGLLPRVSNCTDGSFCCDDDAECCADRRGIFLNGDGVIASSDIGLLPTSTSSKIMSATAGPTTMAPSASTSATQAPSGSSTNQSTSTSGLSTGAKAGLGVGIALAVLIVLGVVLYYCQSRRRSQASDPAYGRTEIGAGPDHDQKKMQPGQGQSVPLEMPGNWQGYEKDGSKAHRVYEMPTTTHELPGSRTSREVK